MGLIKPNPVILSAYFSTLHQSNLVSGGRESGQSDSEFFERNVHNALHGQTWMGIRG